MCVEKWISVTDRLPEGGQHVLVHDMQRGVGEAIHYVLQNGKILWTDAIEEYFNYKNVTHWMPLPDPPKEYSENE